MATESRFPSFSCLSTYHCPLLDLELGRKQEEGKRCPGAGKRVRDGEVGGTVYCIRQGSRPVAGTCVSGCSGAGHILLLFWISFTFRSSQSSEESSQSDTVGSHKVSILCI